MNEVYIIARSIRLLEVLTHLVCIQTQDLYIQAYMPLIEASLMFFSADTFHDISQSYPSCYNALTLHF